MTQFPRILRGCVSKHRSQPDLEICEQRLKLRVERLTPFIILQRAENIYYKNLTANSHARETQPDLQQDGPVDLSQGLVQSADGRLQHGGHQDGSVQVVLGHHTRVRFEEHQNPAVTLHTLQLHKDKTSFSFTSLRM